MDFILLIPFILFVFFMGLLIYVVQPRLLPKRVQTTGGDRGKCARQREAVREFLADGHHRRGDGHGHHWTGWWLASIGGDVCPGSEWQRLCNTCHIREHNGARYDSQRRRC